MKLAAAVLAVILLVVILLVEPGAAAAQEPEPRPDTEVVQEPEPRPDTEVAQEPEPLPNTDVARVPTREESRAELREINGVSGLATGLYIGGIVALVGGLGALGTGILFFFIDFNVALLVGVPAALVFFGGISTLVAAASVDRHSGRRRETWRQERDHITVGAIPILSARF